jgi:precorrin-6A/cobalt-precorrin-6A reductase
VDAGVQPHNVVTGKGPFTEADNVALIEQFGVRSLVMKDSGVAGGTPAKLAAAQRTGCALVLLARPRVSSQDVYRDFAGLVASLKQRFTGTDPQSMADRQGRPPCLPG